MRKKLYALSLSLIIHSLLILPLHANKTETIKLNFSVQKIEFVPSKTMEQQTSIVRKSFHGKRKIKNITKTINRPMQVKGNKLAQQYFTDVRKVFLKNSSSSIKAQKLKLKGDVLVKIQIQKDGNYDILFIDGDNAELISLANKTMSKIESFPPIPESLGQTEIQLKVPLKYKFD